MQHPHLSVEQASPTPSHVVAKQLAQVAPHLPDASSVDYLLPMVTAGDSRATELGRALVDTARQQYGLDRPAQTPPRQRRTRGVQPRVPQAPPPASRGSQTE